jgi:CRP/FNR family cyclic AMP-dependent transcriptional regulator
MPDGRLRIPERLTHREMASRAGCSREMISRVLKDLETGGYVTLDDGCLVLLRALPPRW